MKLLCKLKKIGGQQGKRVYIQRVRRIKLSNHCINHDGDEVMTKYPSQLEKPCICYISKDADCLKVKRESIELDHFMELMLLNNDSEAELCEIEYDQGEIVSLSSIPWEEIKRNISLMPDGCEDYNLCRLRGVFDE